MLQEAYTSQMVALLQGPAVAVRFADDMGKLLVSAGADGSLLLIDRRLDGVAACARTGCCLSALDVHQDGQSLAVGTTGAESLISSCLKTSPS